MDLTPDALREVTFRGRLGGYHVDDVDEFVEKVAVGVGALLDQLRLVSERASAAERRTKELAASEEATKRTLVHAQKLADAVLAEARQEAARISAEAVEAAAAAKARAKEGAASAEAELEAARADVAQLRAEVEAARATSHEQAAALVLEAEAEAERLRGEAAAEAQRLRAEAEAEVERLRAEAAEQLAAARGEADVVRARAAADADVEVQAEVQRLAGVRATLQLEAAALAAWLDERRLEVRGVLERTAAQLDDALVVEPPAVSAVHVPVVQPLAAVEAAPPLPVEPIDVAPVERDHGAIPVPAASEPEAAAEPEPEPRAAPVVDDRPTAAVPVVDVGDDGAAFVELSDEEFLAELQKAAAGVDEPLGPRDEG